MTAPDRPARTFTVAEATGLVPFVRSRLAVLRDALARMRALAPVRDDDTGSVARPTPESPVPSAYLAAMERMASAANDLTEAGVQLKDLETGLVDFPALARGRIVLLCLRDGEDEIGWFHEVEDGFAGRRPLAELDLPGEPP